MLLSICTDELHGEQQQDAARGQRLLHDTADGMVLVGFDVFGWRGGGWGRGWEGDR